MDISKYYDPILDRPLTLEDGCSWEAWLAGAESRFTCFPPSFPSPARGFESSIWDAVRGISQMRYASGGLKHRFADLIIRFPRLRSPKGSIRPSSSLSLMPTQFRTVPRR